MRRHWRFGSVGLCWILLVIYEFVAATEWSSEQRLFALPQVQPTTQLATPDASVSAQIGARRIVFFNGVLSSGDNQGIWVNNRPMHATGHIAPLRSLRWNARVARLQATMEDGQIHTLLPGQALWLLTNGIARVASGTALGTAAVATPGAPIRARP